MARKWKAFAQADGAYLYDAAGLKKHWARLHRGDCEPLPKDAAVLDAWRAFHVRGDAGAFAPTLRQLAHAVHPGLRVYDVLTLDGPVDRASRVQSAPGGSSPG